MQLQNARLCLDCEEVHNAMVCPACMSESFVYLTRWVSPSSPDAKAPPRPKVPPSAEAATYRRLIVADAMRPKAYRLLKRGAIGLTVISLARWAWRRHKSQAEPGEPESER
jgi:hypothetical protein